MITFGVCLIYYGIALFLYQIYGWLSAGIWTPFPVSRAWEAFLGAPRPGTPIIDDMILWFLTWPLGLALLFSGLSVLGTVFTAKRVLERRRDRLRLKWLLEQCEAAGYKPWALPKLIGDLDKHLKREKIT